MGFRDLSAPDDARVILAAGAPSPRVAIVAGSGLGGLAARVEDAVRVPYSALPSVPDLGAVVGHAGELVCGTIGGTPVAVFAGRAHMYQGATALQSAFPARIAASLGCDAIILTCAAGGISGSLAAGDLVCITDHLNLTGRNPLEGWLGPEGGNPFVSMRDAYDPELRALALEVADAEDVTLHQGVYAGLLGPSYETPAEVAMLLDHGADVVGMSTVAETIAARALGLRVLGISLVSNAAAGVGLSHAEVLQAGREAASRIERLVVGILRKL